MAVTLRAIIGKNRWQFNFTFKCDQGIINNSYTQVTPQI